MDNGKSISGRGNSQCRGPDVGASLVCSGKSTAGAE